MGGMWTSLTLRGVDQQRVVEAVRALGRTAFVGPAEGEWVPVFDEACDAQDVDDTMELGTSLTRELGVPGLAVLVHDGDTFTYWLFDRGELMDQYDSWPRYHEGEDPEPSGGDAALLCRVLGVPERVREVDAALHAGDDYLNGDDVHARVFEALGLPETTVSMSYRYLARGERPGGEDDGGGPDDPFVLVRAGPRGGGKRRAGLRAVPDDDERDDEAAPRHALKFPGGQVAAEAFLQQAFAQVWSQAAASFPWATVLEGLERQVDKAEERGAPARDRDRWHHLTLQLPALREMRPHLKPASLVARLDALIARIEAGPRGETD